MVVLLVLAACAPQRPSMSLQDVVVESVDFAGTTARVRVALDNPLPVALTYTGPAYEVRLGDRIVASGVGTGGTIAASATSSLELPITVAFGPLASLLLEDEVRVELTGKVSVTEPLSVELPFSWEGVLPRLEAPEVELVGLRWTDDEVRSGRVAWALDVRVEPAAAVRPVRLDWALTLQGEPLAGGRADVDSAGVLAVPVHVDLGALGPWLSAVVTGRPAVVAAWGTVVFDTPFGEVPLEVRRGLSIAARPPPGR